MGCRRKKSGHCFWAPHFKNASAIAGRGQFHAQERHCLANKVASFPHKHNGKEQDSGNNAA